MFAYSLNNQAYSCPYPTREVAIARAFQLHPESSAIFIGKVVYRPLLEEQCSYTLVEDFIDSLRYSTAQTQDSEFYTHLDTLAGYLDQWVKDTKVSVIEEVETVDNPKFNSKPLTLRQRIVRVIFGRPH